MRFAIIEDTAALTECENPVDVDQRVAWGHALRILTFPFVVNNQFN